MIILTPSPSQDLKDELKESLKKRDEADKEQEALRQKHETLLTEHSTFQRESDRLLGRHNRLKKKHQDLRDRHEKVKVHQGELEEKEKTTLQRYVDPAKLWVDLESSFIWIQLVMLRASDHNLGWQLCDVHEILLKLLVEQLLSCGIS